MKKVFITGIAGFIGFHTALKYHENGWSVCGADNFNDYYDPSLKENRKDLLIDKGIQVVRMDIRSDDLSALVKKNSARSCHSSRSRGWCSSVSCSTYILHRQ